MLPRFDARRYLETVAQHRCTLLSGIPTMFALMVRERDLIETPRSQPRPRCHHRFGAAHRRAARAGQRIVPERRRRERLRHDGGGSRRVRSSSAGLPRPPLSLGYPLADIGCELVDGESAEQGVLALRTPALMQGYSIFPQATASRMRDGWYLTGDIDAPGHGGLLLLRRAGRRHVRLRRRERLSRRSGEASRASPGHRAGHRGAAPDDIKGQIPVAFIVPRSGAQSERRGDQAATRCARGRHMRIRDSSNFCSSPPVSRHSQDRSHGLDGRGRAHRQSGRPQPLTDSYAEKLNVRISRSHHLGLRRPRRGYRADSNRSPGCARDSAACTRAG